MTVNDELQRMRKEVLVAYFKVNSPAFVWNGWGKLRKISE